MYMIILYLISVLFNMSLFVFESQILPKRIAVWKMLPVAFVLALFTMARNLSLVNIDKMNIISTIYLSVWIACLLILFKGKLWKRLLVGIYFTALMFLSDICIWILLSTLTRISEISQFRESNEFIAGGIISLILFLIIGSVSVMIWRIIITHKFQPFYLLFLILPIGQFFFTYHIFYSTGILGFFGALLSLMADIVLLVYTVSQENKTALEAELQAVQHVMKLEQAHYNEVEQRREELARIRHDFNNQLAVIQSLMRSGDDASAQEMVCVLTNEIKQTNENPYCGIPVINAVLAEKEMQLKEVGARLQVELDIPQLLAVEKSHLCSIFSNLLDNAIRACAQLGENIQPVVLLSSMEDGGYLFFKTTNPAIWPAKKPEVGHGYGTRILTDLAKSYGGVYHTEYRDGNFFAVVSLPVEAIAG